MALQTDLLETSFKLLREQETEFTSYFYGNLFEDYPHVKPLFTTTDMKKQAKKLFASLGLVVDNLKKPDILTSALKALAERHVGYGTLSEHYPIVGSNMLKAMALTLKEQWTPEYEDAWTEAYIAITTIMLDGTDYPPETLTLKRPTIA